MIEIINRHAPLTVVAFSGIAPRNHVFEWLTALSSLPVNVVGVKDPHEAWWQIDGDRVTMRLSEALRALGPRRWVALGASAGGFGAILFGRGLGASRIVTFVPQTACGAAKRALGDLRWHEHCDGTPSMDIGAFGDGVEVHVGDDPLDLMHAQRLKGAEVHRYPGIGHDLPHVLKQERVLERLLENAVMEGAF